MRAGWADVNGKLIRSDEAQISVFDRGFMWGDSVVEATRVHAGVPFELDAHISRLLRSVSYAGLRAPPHHEFRDRAERLLAHAPATDGVLRLCLTAGLDTGTVPISGETEPNSVLTLTETPALAPLAERGVDALVSTFQQVQRLALDPRAGTGSGLALVLAAREARTLGYAEAIVFDHQGFAVGSATDALFAWVHDCWYTPPAECAHGEIARGVALELLAANDEPFVEHPLREDDLQSADEMLLVGSLRAVTPVIALNGDPVGAGKVGEATARLADWFAARWLPR